MTTLLTRIFGANWRTSVSAFGATIMAAIAFIAQMSYDQGPLSLVFPAEFKPLITKIAGIAALLLFFWNGIRQKDKDVVGGTVVQAPDGSIDQVKTNLVIAQQARESRRII
jgi:hypothetical protein